MLTMELNTVDAPDPHPYRRLTRRFVITGVAIAALGVAGAASLGGRSPGPHVEVVQPLGEQVSPSSSVVPPTTAPPAETTPTTLAPPPPPAERLTAASRVRLDGIGPVRVGMTVDEASAAAGLPIQMIPNPVSDRCAHARPVGGPEHLRFMVVDGKVARVEAGPGITTLSGVGVGSTEAEVLAAYPGQIRVEPNPYMGHRGFHTMVYTPTDPAFAGYGLIFETDGERVNSFRSGFAGPVAWIEGCL